MKSWESEKWYSEIFVKQRTFQFVPSANQEKHEHFDSSVSTSPSGRVVLLSNTTENCGLNSRSWVD